jgi:DNA repair protein RAD5
LTLKWSEEIQKHLVKDYDIFIYHGAKKLDYKTLATVDFVITTYGTTVSEYKNMMEMNGKNYDLFKVNWNRIILDEAHAIKNPNAMRSKAICELKSKYKWALTGTPIQNSLTDIYSLFKFIQYAPYSDKGVFKSILPENGENGYSPSIDVQIIFH